MERQEMPRLLERHKAGIDGRRSSHQQLGLRLQLQRAIAAELEHEAIVVREYGYSQLPAFEQANAAAVRC